VTAAIRRVAHLCTEHTNSVHQLIATLSRARVLAFAAVLAGVFTAPAIAAPRGTVDVAIATTAGPIVVRLDRARAPGTVDNFLHYVDTHAYDGAIFYRTVRRSSEPQSRIEVIQGGLHPETATTSNKPIPIEPTSKTGLHNVDGTIAMARLSDPNSATTEFFIDIGDNTFLDAGGPLGPGYAAFGHVIRGMDVVRRIHTAPAEGQMLSPPIKITTVRRVR
jgi:peptidyl-prolyl cis-trans isomerase A (cyclophilin A)